MYNTLLYCPKCGRKTIFVIKIVTLDVEGLPDDFAESVRIVCCSQCESPLAYCIREEDFIS